MKKIMVMMLSLCAALVLAVGCVKKGGRADTEFVMGNGTELQSIDPTQVEGVPEHHVQVALFEGLTRYDPQTAKPIPGVAESWTLSDDGTVYTFTIRDGLAWSDGTPITAQTMVDSWLHHLNPTTGSRYAYMPGMIIKGADDYNTKGGKRENVAIRATGERSFEVTMVGRIPYALEVFAHQAFSPLPMHVIEQYGADWIKKEHFVCNGPFVLKEWIPNDHLTVTKNDAYWDKDNVHLTQITFLPIEDMNTAYKSFKNGEIDWNYGIPLAMIDELKLEKYYQAATSLGSYYYYVNTKHPILKDPRIRKALSMSFDRQELVDKVTKAGQVPAFALSPPMGGYTPAKGTGYDVAAAQQLLADAGYPEGKGLPELSLIYNTLDSHKMIAEYLQETWKNNLGVNVSLSNLEWATFLTERKSSKSELSRAGWSADYADPMNFLELLITGGGNNDGQYSNPEYDALLRQAAELPDGPQRSALLHDAEEIAITRDQAVIPIYYYVSLHLIDTDVWDGWYNNPMDIHSWVGIKKK